MNPLHKQMNSLKYWSVTLITQETVNVEIQAKVLPHIHFGLVMFKDVSPYFIQIVEHHKSYQLSCLQIAMRKIDFKVFQ